MQNAEFCETNERCQIDGHNNIKKHNTLTEQSLHSCLGKVGFLLYTAPQFGQFLPFGICFPPIKKNEAWRHTSFFSGLLLVIGCFGYCIYLLTAVTWTYIFRTLSFMFIGISFISGRAFAKTKNIWCANP